MLRGCTGACWVGAEGLHRLGPGVQVQSGCVFEALVLGEAKVEGAISGMVDRMALFVLGVFLDGILCDLQMTLVH